MFFYFKQKLNQIENSLEKFQADPTLKSNHFEE